MCNGIWATAVGLARNGGLAPYAAVRACTLHKLPDSVDLLSAAWVEPLGVALRTVRRSGIEPGADAVVIGGGPVGLLVTTILGSMGMGTLTVVEPNPKRSEIALQQGANEAIDPFAVELTEHFAARAPQFVYECSGVAVSVSNGAAILAPHGTLCLTGFSRKPPFFNSGDVLWKELRILGSFIYVQEFADAISLLAKGGINVKPLVTGVLPVAEAPKAFEAMRTSPDTVKYLMSDFH
jgi:threonine dehydrogenase-like Zn-dependent dehydrogenase